MSAALATFVQAGGGVVLIAERAGVGGAATVNAIAAELGVSARVREDDFAQGCNVAKAVGTHPLVSGASDLAYAWGSTTTGGTSLFRLGDKDVVTVEGSVVLAGDSDSFGDGGSLGSCGPEVGKTFFANLYRALPSR